MNFKKILYIFLILVAVAVATSSILYPATFQNTLSVWVKSAQEHALGREFIVIPQSFPEGNLSNEGVILATNRERTANSEQSFKENAKLDAAAEIKLRDMFTQQYFEHISPQGHGPGYLADEENYSYLIVGENLALGNFKDDAALLAAWMASPGHRANILNSQFSDIGVAVGKGMYQGKETWLAVQEFGTPSSVCPNINSALKDKVDSDKAKSDAFSKNLDTIKSQLDVMSQNTASERAAYNAKVGEYNSLVGQYTNLTQTLRNEIDDYNTEVRTFNNCLNAHQSSSPAE